MSEGLPSVLHVLPHLDDNGNGVVASAVSLIKYQLERGYNVSIAAHEGALGAGLTERGAELVELSKLPKLVAAGLNGLRLGQFLKRNRVDIVHCHTVGNIPASIIASLVSRTKLVATAHSFFRKEENMVRFADHIIAVSADNERRLKAQGIQPVTAVLNGVARPTDVRPYGQQRFDGPVLFVGGMYRRKGVDVLLRAFSMSPSTIQTRGLRIVGDGPERRYFENLALELGIGKCVRFLGFQNDIEQEMQKASLFVCPSLEEPFGLVVAEARMNACPVIASDVGGIPEVLSDGRAGLLVTPGDHEELSRAITRSLSSLSEAQRLSRDATRDVSWLGIERMGAQTESVYESTLATPPRLHLIRKNLSR